MSDTQKEVNNITEVLKKLNKSKSGADKIDFLSSMPKDFLFKGFISTGSPFIDYLSGGGHSRTGMTLVTGWESSGKSSMLLTAVRSAQKQYPKKTPVIFDGEGSITQNYFDRMGVDSKNLIIIKEKNLEEMLDTAEAFSKADDVSIICIDSIKSFYSSIDEAKSAEEYSMGGTAKRWNTRMPIISANCYRRGINILLIHQWRQDPGKMMGDSRVLSGGMWVKYMPDLHIDLTKKELITDENKTTVGHKLDVRIKKSKFSTYNPKESYTVNFYYEGGFNEIDENVQVLIVSGIIKQTLGWYTLPNKDGEEVKINGMDKVVKYMKDNIKEYEFLLKQLKK